LKKRQELGYVLFHGGEAEHFQPGPMRLSRHGFGRRFLHHPFMPAAHERLMVEIKLEQAEGFLADELAFLQMALLRKSKGSLCVSGS